MLVLSRKSGEQIFVGNDVTVTVVRISNNSVRIGITAPKNMPIIRDEIETKELPIQASEDDVKELGVR